MMGELISIGDQNAWERALVGVRHAFAHTWANCHAMSLTSGDATYLCRFGSGDSHVVCPIAERRYGDYVDIYTPYGFSGFTGATPSHCDFSRELECVRPRARVRVRLLQQPPVPSLGIPTLNLGGGVRGYDGVARFKERFGGKTMRLRCAKQIYRPDVYRRLCRTAGVDPKRERRYFPAYRAAGIGRELGAAG